MARRLIIMLLLGLAILAGPVVAEPGASPPPAPVPPATGQPAAPTNPPQAQAEPRADFDTWLDTNLNDSLASIRGVFDNLFLVRPSIWDKSQAWVITGWSWLLLFGLPVAGFAAVVQGVQVLRGDDSSLSELGRRLVIPITSVLLMAFTPVIYETVRVTQEYLWMAPATDFDPKASTDVLAVALPQVGRVGGDATPQPGCTSGWWRCAAADAWEAMKKTPVVGGAIKTGEKIVAAYNFVRGVRVRTGVFFSTWNVLNLIILGLVAFLVYLAGCFLVIVAGFYLGLAALARNLEPMAGWVDLIIRTVLMSSVFNLAWLLMRGMPVWLQFAGLDAMFYSVTVLPLTIWVVYRLWFVRLGEVIADPVMLGGAKVIGRWAGRMQVVGSLLAAAGTVTGQPALAGAGSALSGWANRTATQAQNWEASARDGGSRAVVNRLVESALRPATPIQNGVPATPPSSGGAGERAAHSTETSSARATPTTETVPTPEPGMGASTVMPCWRDGEQYVIMQHGMPVHVQTLPDGAQLQGDWKGQA